MVNRRKEMRITRMLVIEQGKENISGIAIAQEKGIDRLAWGRVLAQ